MKRLPITDPYLYEYEIHQPQDKDPTLTGRIVAEPYVFYSNTAAVGHGQAFSIGTRKTGERRWVGYALFQPIKGDGPEDYIIEDGKGEPRAWILEEWRQSMSLLVSVGGLEHE